MNRYLLFDFYTYFGNQSDLFYPFQKSNSVIRVTTSDNNTFLLRTTSLEYTKKCVIPDYYMYPENFMLCHSLEKGTFIVENKHPNPPEIQTCPLNILNPERYIVIKSEIIT